MKKNLFIGLIASAGVCTAWAFFSLNLLFDTALTREEQGIKSLASAQAACEHYECLYNEQLSSPEKLAQLASFSFLKMHLENTILPALTKHRTTLEQLIAAGKETEKATTLHARLIELQNKLETILATITNSQLLKNEKELDKNLKKIAQI